MIVKVGTMRRKTKGMARLSCVLAGACMVLLPALSQAIGLGKFTVHSALDEPLNAEIEFTSLTTSERKDLAAKLASRSDFLEAGIDRPPYLTNIKFTIAKRVDGSYFLQLRTREPFTEPFLHFLMSVEWSGGRLIREYTALIDPPYLMASKPAAIEAPVSAPVADEVEAETQPVAPPPVAMAEELMLRPEEAPISPVADADPEQEQAETAPQPVAEAAGKTVKDTPVAAAGASARDYFMAEGFVFAPKGAEESMASTLDAGSAPAGAPVTTTRPATAAMDHYEASSWAGRDGYTVKRGDTLWEVAERLRTDKSLSIEQVVMAIFQNNRSAFFGNNPNNLSAGKILKIPDRNYVQALTPKQARKEFLAHYDVWQEYKLKVASSNQAITVDRAADSKPAKAPPQAAVEPKPTPAKPAAEKKPATEPQKPEAPKPGLEPTRKEGIPADDMLRIVRSTLEREKSQKQAAVPDSETSALDAAKKEQLALAERVETLEETLESKRMETQELGERVGQVKDQLKNQKRLIEIENTNLAQNQEPTARPAQPDTTPAPEAAKVAPPEPAKPVAKTPAQPVKPKRDAPPPPPSSEKDLLTTLMDDLMGGQLMMPLVGLLAVLGGGILLVYMKRRRQATAEFEESILNTSSMDSEGFTSDVSGPPEPGDTSFLSDFSQGGMGNIHTDEVDPIAEAEVYLAYGRDEQAEEILKEAIVKSPSRHELREKLLDIYHQRNDVAAFETLAEELYAALEGRGSSLWNRVAALGKQISPTNPMFTGGAPVAASSRPQPQESVLDMEAPADESMDMAMDFDAGGVSSGGGDLDFEMPAQPSGDATMAIDMDQEFDLSLDTPAEKDLAPAGSSGGIDFDLSLNGDVGGSDASQKSVGDFGGGIDFDPGTTSRDATSDEGLDFESSSELSLGEGLSLDTSDGEDAFSLDTTDEALAEADEPALSPTQNEEQGISWDIDTSADVDFGAGTEAESSDADELDMGTFGTESSDDLAFDAGGGSAGGEDFGLESEDSDVAVAEAGQEWDETATKLDLAKAYIDMGDAEGAKSILDEVLAEGNPDQKKQAAELAAQIA